MSERVGRRAAIRTLIVGAIGLTYTGGVLAAGRAIGLTNQPLPAPQPARRDFDVAELAEGQLEQMEGRRITVEGWPEFVVRHQIKNLTPDGNPFNVDFYRLFEEAYREGPFIYFTRTDPSILAGREEAGKMYENKKVVVEGMVSGDPLGEGRRPFVPTYLSAMADPVVIASVPPRVW